MQWHTDNRRYDKEQGETHTSAPGIIFLAYLSDVKMVNFNIFKNLMFGLVIILIMITQLNTSITITKKI